MRGNAARHARTGGKVLRPGKARYVPAIDGLRAFAVLAVIFYHMGLGWAPGGLMGVTVFFVISGYLINGLLVSERQRTGRISLTQFWLRRARRILPAVILAIAGTVALCALISPALLAKARPDIVPSLLFYNNWWQIFRDISYFEAAGAPSPLTHYWSLAIEEQFYLVWPIVLALLLNAGVRRKGMAILLLVLAVASGVEMAVLFDPSADPSRVYYGTDTRAMSLLLGAWLAIVWPSAAFGPMLARKPSSTTRLALNLGGTAALLGLIAIVGFTNGFSAFPYQGGIALTSALAALLIASVVLPDSWMARLFQLKPLVWVGKRSYSMYLWHFPIILLTSKIGLPIDVPWWVRIAQLVVIIAISDLSFRFVEDPIRKGGLKAWANERKNGIKPTFGTSARRALTVLAVAGVLVGAGAGLVLVSPPATASQSGDAVAIIVKQAKPRMKSTLEAEEKREAKQRAAEEKKAAKTAYEKLVSTRQLNKAGEPVYEPLLIGDSVSAGAEDAFYKVFPNGHIDALVNRNIWESPYNDYLGADQVGTFVVFCLGTNNAVVEEQVDELLSGIADDKKVILVNTRSPREWVASTNEALANAAKRHKNVVAVIDWYGESANHGEYFWDDGTHLRPEGAQAYIALIEEAMKQAMGAK